MRRYDAYGFRHLGLEEAARFVERTVGVRMTERDSSYRGIYYCSLEGSGYVVQANDDDQGKRRSKDSAYGVILRVNEQPDMDRIREALTVGPSDPAFLHSSFITYFIANLKCPVCGHISPADMSTNMQTRLMDGQEIDDFKVGDSLVVDPERIRRMDYKLYWTVRVPSPGEPIRILEMWECPACETNTNWAEVVIRDSRIESIDAVAFDRVHFERCSLVGYDVISVAADLTGKPFSEIEEQGVVQVLREKLPLPGS